MTRHPSHGRRRPAQAPAVNRRRRKRRARTRQQRSHRMLLLGLLLGVPVVMFLTLTVGATAVFGSSCDLNALQPVAVGENSFVYAADGSELGVIPAERNRTPVSRSEMSPWMPKATVAIEDRRLYEHGGGDPVGNARAVVAVLRARNVRQGRSP